MNEYIYTTHNNQLVHVLKLHSTSNRKLGVARRVITTYHFSIDQILSNDLKLDRKTCGDCPYSYNQEHKHGSCYCHKNLQRLGLNSMIKRLHNNTHLLQPLSMDKFNSFLNKALKYDVELLRFGAYGEAVNMPYQIVSTLAESFKKRTAYTHRWHLKSVHRYAKYFMASTDSSIEVALANDLGWRVFNIGPIDNAVNCPASKEQGKKTTCSQCVLCNGVSGNSSKNLFINQH